MKQKKNVAKGIGLVVFLILEFAAVGYDALFNESRIIHPIDFATYQFRPTDAPLLLATLMLVIYVVCLAFSAVILELRKGKTGEGADGGQRITRKLNPAYGWLGITGFLGFLGIPVYLMEQHVWPFFFFIFFGFFGFFYEAKMSETLMDECFLEEKRRAQLTAYKTGFGLFWIVTWVIAVVGNRFSTDVIALIFSISSPLIIALVMFLNHYLVYKYDTEEVN